MIRDAYSYFLRDLKKAMNGKIYLVAALAMPAAWLVFVGVPLRPQFSGDYLAFITPSIMVMAVLFTAFQGGGLLVFDKIMGFMNKFLAMPAPRESILLGRVSFVTFKGLLQATVLLVIALLLGVGIPGPIQIVLMYVALGAFGALFAGVAMMIALAVSDHDRYATVNSIISMPLFFASTALMPYDQMPSWLRVVASLNPVSYAIDTTRSLMSGGMPAAGILELLAVALAVTAISMYAFRKATV